jgi:Lrp/AsnC family transcriptional regulator, leucine-responsive regulatory protein
MDRTDRDLLALLIADGRSTVQDLADRIRLSPSATRDRIKRLETTGVVSGYSARVDDAALGFPVDALVEVDLAAGDDGIAFQNEMVSLLAVVEVLHATGEHDFVLRLSCRTTDELHTVVRDLKARHGVARTLTRVVLQSSVARRPRIE